MYTSTIQWENLPENPVFQAIGLANQPGAVGVEDAVALLDEGDENEEGGDLYELPPSYELPTFPGVRKDMELNQGEISDTMQNSMVDIIYNQVHELMGNKRALKSGQYRKIAMKLCEQYPSSRNRRVLIPGVRLAYKQHENWLKKLRQKFRKLRRGVNTAERRAARERFTPNRVHIATPRLDARPDRSSCGLLPSDVDVGEDDTTIASHIREIQQEWLKAQPSMALIQDRLRRTKVSRKKAMSTGNPSTVLDDYPIFTCPKMVLLECQLQSGLDHAVLREQFVTPERVQRIMKIAGDMRYSRQMRKMMKLLDLCLPQELRAAEKDFILLIVPILAKEEMRLWVVFDEEVQTEFPTLRVLTQEGQSPFVQYKQLEVWVFKQKFCTAAADSGITLGNGIDALIAASVLFNIIHPDACLKTWRFISEQVYKYPGPPPSRALRGKYPRLGTMFHL